MRLAIGLLLDLTDGARLPRFTQLNKFALTGTPLRLRRHPVLLFLSRTLHQWHEPLAGSYVVVGLSGGDSLVSSPQIR